MKHLKIVMLAFTLVFSVAAIATPTNDKTPKAPKAHKANKAIKTDNIKKPMFFPVVGVPKYSEAMRKGTHNNGKGL